MVEWRFPHHEWGYEPHKWRLVREWRIVGFASRDSLGQLQRSQKPLADGTFSVFSGNLFFQLYVFFVSLAIVESIPVAYYVLPEKDAQMYLKTVENLKSHLFHNIWYSLTHHRLGESSREDVAWYPKCLDEKVDGLKKKTMRGGNLQRIPSNYCWLEKENHLCPWRRSILRELNSLATI